MKTVVELLDEARVLLPFKCSPMETLHEIKLGTLVIYLRGDEQQREDGLIPGAITIRRRIPIESCCRKSSVPRAGKCY